MYFTIKLLLLFLGLDLFIYWVFSKNLIYIILGLTNSIFLLKVLWYKFNIKYNLVQKIIVFIKNTINKISNIHIFKHRTQITNNYKSQLLDSKKLKEKYNALLIIINSINKHYILIISFFIFNFILFSKITWLNSININIYSSFIILIISSIVWYKDILSWDIYLWKKKIKFIDYIVFLSLIIFYIFFSINWDLKNYERFFIASLFTLTFFIFTTNFLEIRKIKYWNHKISSYFMTLFLLSCIYFSYWFLNIKNMYHDFYVWKTKIILNKNWEKVFITPDNKEYRIIKNWSWYILKSFNWKKYLFDTTKEAEKYILWFYKEDKFINDKFSENEISNNEAWNTIINWTGSIINNWTWSTITSWTWNLTDKELIPYILKNKNYDYLYDSNLILPNINHNMKYYKYYNIAYKLWIISHNSDLTDTVYCENYVAVLWIADKWNMTKYKNIKLFDKYYLEWDKRWVIPKQCIKNKKKIFKLEFLR